MNKIVHIMFLILLSLNSVLAIEELKDNHLTSSEIKWLKENHTVHVRVANWPPFQMNKDDKFNGISVDYIKLIFAKYNIKYKFISSKQYPWREALESIKNKSGVDLILTAKITEDRKKDMLFSKNYISTPWVIFTKEDSFPISNIDDLNGKTVSVQDGFVMQKLLEKNYPKINLHIVKGTNVTEKALGALAVGISDAYIGNVIAGSYLIKELDLINIKVAAPTPFGLHENAMAIRDDWSALVSIINKELNIMSTKQKDEIRNKYLALKYEYGISPTDLLKYIGVVILFFVIIISIILFYTRKLSIEANKRRELQNKVEEQIKKLKYSQKIAKLGFWEHHLVEDKLYWSDEIYNILELSKDKVSPSYELYLDMIDPQDRDMVNEKYSTSLINKKKYSVVHRFIMPNKKIKWVKQEFETTYDKDDKPIISIGTTQDITQEYELNQTIREQEKRLFQQAKLASMGEMIENIAHQWRQPIAIISMWANNIVADIDMDEVKDKNLRKYANNINEQTKYLSQTIEDFRDFFIPSKEKIAFTLKFSIDKTINLLTASFKTHNIEVIEDIEDIEITSLENELTQAFLNIIKNAKDALVILPKESRRLIFINIYKKNNTAFVEIKDNGGGISEDIIDKIFEPYFTTKHKSQGTGIGLYMTQSIITKHLNGIIAAQNIEYEYEGEKYKGVRFIIEIPV